MPKYTNDYIAGYVLYFTSKCIVEAMHVHASNRQMSVATAAKIYVYEDGETKVEKWGSVNENDMLIIRQYIKDNYVEMHEKWETFGGRDYYRKK